MKYVSDCTALHLAGRGITRLGGFDRLTNLEARTICDRSSGSFHLQRLCCRWHNPPFPPSAIRMCAHGRECRCCS